VDPDPRIHPLVYVTGSSVKTNRHYLGLTGVIRVPVRGGDPPGYPHDASHPMYPLPAIRDATFTVDSFSPFSSEVGGGLSRQFLRDPGFTRARPTVSGGDGGTRRWVHVRDAPIKSTEDRTLLEIGVWE